MKTRYKLAIAVALMCAAGAGAYMPARSYLKQRNKPKWQTAEIEKGKLLYVVNSTGTVKPVLSMHVGAVVSGPVKKLCADFNDEVKKGQLLAVIDPQLYDAAVARDTANLKTRQAEQKRVEAQVAQATNDFTRGQQLFKENPDYISRTELDQLKFGLKSQEAALDVAKAAVEQAQASLNNSLTNKEYTNIISPVDGIVIDRKIDEGQALASSFQAPELFIVAPDLRKKMFIYATVDENDIGMVRKAQTAGQSVEFRVSAYPDDIFKGQIEEIRLSSSELQNVVTYPVIVAASNPDLKLLPGMTAEISFNVEERQNAVKIPNAALRYYPEDRFVRPEDQKLLKGEAWEKKDKDEPEVILSAAEKAASRKKRNSRTVWVVEGELLRAVEVTIGLSDSKFTEMVSGKLKPGDQVVTGTQLP